MAEENIQSAEFFAENYDSAITCDFWPGPEIIFNLSEKYILPKANLLDLGTGTGASIIPFVKTGAVITGVDGSNNMLEICRSKNIASRLVHHNLENTPYPFLNNEFYFIVSHAVFHLLHPIDTVFSEVSRILKSAGYFCFTFDDAIQPGNYKEIEPGIWQTKTPSGVLTFKHDKNYLERLLYSNGFNVIKETRYLAFVNQELNKEFWFTAILAQKC
jgi:predicted TPR repeat methyltransferase